MARWMVQEPPGAPSGCKQKNGELLMARCDAAICMCVGVVEQNNWRTRLLPVAAGGPTLGRHKQGGRVLFQCLRHCPRPFPLPNLRPPTHISRFQFGLFRTATTNSDRLISCPPARCILFVVRLSACPSAGALADPWPLHPPRQREEHHSAQPGLHPLSLCRA